MGRTGVTVGGVAHVVGGVAFGTTTTSGAAIVAGAAAGAAYLAVIPASGAITAGTSFGKLGTVIANQAGKISGFIREGTSDPYHALDRAIYRGVSTQARQCHPQGWRFRLGRGRIKQKTKRIASVCYEKSFPSR